MPLLAIGRIRDRQLLMEHVIPQRLSFEFIQRNDVSNVGQNVGESRWVATESLSRECVREAALSTQLNERKALAAGSDRMQNPRLAPRGS